MSIRDPFYVAIEDALAAAALDTDLLERLAAELVESKGYATNLAVGGADNGYDFEILDSHLEPGPGVVTTSNRVTENLRRNLDRNKKSCPRAARKTFIVTSSLLTPRKRDNLKRAAAERGYMYLGASDRRDVARYIYANPHWAQELLGLTGQPSALSVVPRTSRPLVDLPLTGREEAYQWLRQRERDALVVGSPGSGKTALLAALVAKALGSFMVSTDMTAVANAIRQQRPAVVIVDDLDDTVGACRELSRLRAEMGAEFKIVVTDWEANPELQQVLGLGDADVLALGLLTRDEIVDVVRAVGIAGPNELVREIVNQAEGVPGLAVTLTQAAVAGDYQALFEGNRLGTLMESTVNRLLGNPRDGDRAVLVLGAVALAGDSGLTLEDTAEFVGASKSEVQGLLRRLTSGGVIRSDSRSVTLRPRALRRFMIRKAFFGPGAADYTPLMAVAPNRGETATELVLAARAGAVVPRLLDIVIASGDTMAARYFVGSGARQARDFLEAAPEMAIHVATEALHTAPEVVMPSLLLLAAGDSRELHGTPKQPLRLIKDWANSGVPGTGDAVSRKRVVVTSALSWAAEGADFNTACRACAEVMRTTSEGTETDPGQGRTFSLFRGLLTDDEIRDLRPLWDRIRAAIGEHDEVPWHSLISMCWNLIHPSVFGDPPTDAFEASRRFGESVLADLGVLAAEHPGVLDRLNTLREHLGHDEFYAIPRDFEVLLGDRGHDDWRREEEEGTSQISELAETWAAGDPDGFASRLRWLRDEAERAGRAGYDRSPFLCRLVAAKVADPGRWMASMVAAGATPACILPFIERVVSSESEERESIVLDLLEEPSLECAAIDVALRARHISDEMWSALSERLARYPQLIETLCLRQQVSSDTLRKLLGHHSGDVAHATAVGMWTGETRGEIADELRPEWESAVIRIDDDEYWLDEMLASCPKMAADWLRARIRNNDWRALWTRKNLKSACRALSDEQRLELLSELPERYVGDGVAAALVGDSETLYRAVLRGRRTGESWKDPLRRPADETWRRHTGVALQEGRTPREVAGATMTRFESWSGPQSAHIQGKIDQFAAWLHDADAGVRAVAEQAIAWLRKDLARALADEHREAIEGLS